MRFAILGADDDTLALAAAAEAAGHRIAWRDDGASDGEFGRWEELLDEEAVDAIIVGPANGADDLRTRQIQELVKLGRPLLVVHPVVPSVISCFEIDLSRNDSGAIVRHYNPLIAAEAVDRVAGWVRDGSPETGPVEQIVATRMMEDRSQRKVLWHFARDAELLTTISGRLDRIGAHAAADGGNAAYASLSVQLSGPQPIPVRWAVEPASGRRELRVALICREGRATLVFDDRDHCETLIVQRSDGETTAPFTSSPPASRAVADFVSAVESRDPASSTWPAALDAMELVDSIEISLRRGRMIDVHHRELTEELAFRGVMSAAGCAVLVVVIPLVLAVAWVAGIFQVPIAGYWPHALLALLALFLLFQTLPKFFKRSDAASRRSEPPPSASMPLEPSESADSDD